MNEKLKMAIVIRSLNRGGAEVLVRELLENEEYKHNFRTCDLISLDNKRVELLKDFKGIDTYIFNVFSASVFNFFTEFRIFYKFVKKSNYQLLHAHLPNAGIAVFFVKLFIPKIKVVYTEHSLVAFYNKATYILNGLIYPGNDYVIFVSNAVQENVDKHVKGKFYKYKRGKVITNGVNANKFLCPAKDGQFLNTYLTVGAVTNMRKEKRLDRWIEVAEKCKKKFANLPIKFILAGDGSEREKVKELVAAKNLDSYIELTGLITDTVPVYNRIDIFLMTSDFEGLPVALLEAMSCSCIPIVTNVGGIVDLNFDNFGYKFDDFNAEKIAEVIFQYYNDRERIIVERKRARQFIVGQHSINNQVSEYLEVYDCVLG